MSILKDFDFSQFMIKDKVAVEELNIENCRVSGIQCKFLRFIKCNFQNVVFENSFYDVYAYIEDCKFTNCEFHDTLEGDDVELSIGYSIFSNCLFDNMKYEAPQVQSDITQCKFVDCDFTNIQIDGDLSFGGLDVTGGKIEKFHFYGNTIGDNTFSNVQMIDVDLNGALIQNKMKDVCFKNVTLKGYSENNTFDNCNTSEMNDLTESH